MDDIMIFTTTLEEHHQVVAEVLSILRENKLFLKHIKCEFEQLETEYLGHVVSHNSVKMDPAKVKGIMDWPILTTRKVLRGFLRFLNFYCRFIKDFASLVHLLNILTSEKKEFIWDDQCQLAFDDLKGTVTITPILAIPTPKDPYCLETDSSGTGIRAVLSQQQDDLWHPVAFLSHSLSKVE